MGKDDTGSDGNLALGLGCGAWAFNPESFRKRHGVVKTELKEMGPEPLLTLRISDGTYNDAAKSSWLSPPNSAVSSFSNAFHSSSLKREKEAVSEEDEGERVSSRISDEEDGGSRKKLRLSKEQSTLLEERFKEHSTLNPKQKQALAKQLNLRPRQVEVWFQNRRARTKLKQTEVDCEFLKRCCESLTDENRRLQKELQELRAIKYAAPLYMKLPAATLTMCPSCERIAASAKGDAGKVTVSAASHFAMAPKTHLYNTFATAHPPSAAC